MSNSYDKWLELKQEGKLQYDPTNWKHVVNREEVKHLKTTILLEAMDLIRENQTLSNSAAILLVCEKMNIR